MSTNQILQRLLNSDAGRAAAADIAKENAVKRKAINAQIAKLSKARDSAVDQTHTEFQRAKKRYTAAEAEAKAAKTGLFLADKNHKRAQSLHGKELRDLAQQLAELETQEAQQ